MFCLPLLRVSTLHRIPCLLVFFSAVLLFFLHKITFVVLVVSSWLSCYLLMHVASHWYMDLPYGIDCRHY